MTQRKPISYAYLSLKALHNFPGAPRRQAWAWAVEAAGGAFGGAAEGEERGYGGKSWQKQYKKYINTQENQLTKRA